MSVREKASLVGTLNVGGLKLEPDAVRYTPQDLTELQKAQARLNIGIDELPKGIADYNELTNKPIERIESLDTENLVNFRDLDSGQYLLYGYFSPYENSDISISADNSLVSVVRKSAGSHLICLDPLNAKIVFFEILVDDTAEKGFQYTRTIIPVLKLNDLLNEIGEISELTTEDKTSLVLAVNELNSKSVRSVNGVTPDENGNVQIEVQSTPDALKVMFVIFLDPNNDEYVWCDKLYDEILEYYNAGKTIEAGCWKYSQYYQIELSFVEGDDYFEFVDPDSSNYFWRLDKYNCIDGYLDRDVIPI